MEYKKIGKAIKTARTDAKLTQAELAQKIGKGMSTVQKYEMGVVEPSMDTLLKISDVLSVPIESLLGFPPMSVRISDVYHIEVPEPKEIDPDLTNNQVEHCRRLTKDLLEKSGKLAFEDKKAVMNYVEYLLYRNTISTDHSEDNNQNNQD